MKRLFYVALFFALFSTAVLGADEPSEWAKKEIYNGADKGVIHKDIMCNYKEQINRRDFCKLVVHYYYKNMGYSSLEDFMQKHLKEELAKYEYKFQDLDKNNKDDMYVFVANILELVNGKSNTKFAPNDKLTREQAAKIILGLNEKLSGNPSNKIDTKYSLYKVAFADNDKISNWARYYVYSVNRLGIMKGVGGNKFAPKKYYTREQACVTVTRVNKKEEPLYGTFLDD